VKIYKIDVRKKHTERDLTVELYGCNLKCRHCCSGNGRKLPPKYIGVEPSFERILDLYYRHHPLMLRFTGGEFACSGREAIELYKRVAETLEIPIVIETNLTSIEFYREFERSVTLWQVRDLYFIVSIKASEHVLEGEYDTWRIVSNVRELYRLFPTTYIAHAFIGFKREFRAVLFEYFPELRELEGAIRTEKQGRFRFESLRLREESRDLYYFEQKVKKYRIVARG
jgi:hypothetical protein